MCDAASNRGEDSTNAFLRYRNRGNISLRAVLERMCGATTEEVRVVISADQWSSSSRPQEEHLRSLSRRVQHLDRRRALKPPPTPPPHPGPSGRRPELDGRKEGTDHPGKASGKFAAPTSPSQLVPCECPAVHSAFCGSPRPSAPFILKIPLFRRENSIERGVCSVCFGSVLLTLVYGLLVVTVK